MDENKLKQAFISYLQLKSGALTQEEFENYIQQLGEEGIQQEYTQFIQLLRLRQVSKKRFGGMLNYLSELRGICPEGYEMLFFKRGGLLCKKCMRKIKMEDGGTTPLNPVDAFKCGRKMKKKVEKHLLGGKNGRPQTGFEGLSYEYEPANMPSSGPLWRSYSPETETIRNNGKFLQSRETDYDDRAWLDYGKMEKTDLGYSIGDGVEMDYEPSELTRRTFDSLKRHALMNLQLNKQFGKPLFKRGGLVKKNANCKK